MPPAQPRRASSASRGAGPELTAQAGRGVGAKTSLTTSGIATFSPLPAVTKTSRSSPSVTTSPSR